MTAIVVSQNWDINPNVRNAYVSLVAMTGWFAWQNFEWLRAHGWTVKFTCDGTTGPTSGADTTNRLTTAANFVTRGAAAGNAQSFWVLTNADGLQLMITFQGASDDICRISYSPAAGFVPAGTANQQPTATDEVVVSAANSIVNATTSSDRVMSIWATSRMWSVALFRQSAIVNIIGVEKVTSMVAVRAVNPIFSVPYVGYRYTSAVRATGAGTPCGGTIAAAIGAAAFIGTMARVFTNTAQNIRVGAGELSMPNGSAASASVPGTTITEKPALQNGEGQILLPIYWWGEKTANMDGLLGAPIDWWMSYTNSVNTPALADPYNAYQVGDTPGVTTIRANWLMSFGSGMIRPWQNAASVMDIA